MQVWGLRGGAFSIRPFKSVPLPCRMNIFRHVNRCGQTSHEQTSKSQELLLLQKTFRDKIVGHTSEKENNKTVNRILGWSEKKVFFTIVSSLDYSIFLSFFSVSYSRTYYSRFQLSISDVIVVQKSCSQDRKFTLLWVGLICFPKCVCWRRGHNVLETKCAKAGNFLSYF